MAILSKTFGEDISAANGVSEPAAVVSKQELDWSIERVRSFSVVQPRTLLRRVRSRLIRAHTAEVKTSSHTISKEAQGCCAALAIGGDNFSLEYGVPYQHLGWNAVSRDLSIPTFIWGSSVGPFTANPKFEKEFVRHARTLKAVFVRETETLSYLQRLGLGDRLHLVADPAFAMEPVAPARSIPVPDGAIGINLSPLMSLFVTSGDLDRWQQQAAHIIAALAVKTQRPIVLIPHVNASEATRSVDPGWRLKDDHGFLSRVAGDELLRPHEVTVLDDRLSAPELKFAISRLWAFAGARTHATIAAFGTQVPCISFAYSVKAKGLNKDILGTTDFCIPPVELSPDRVVSAFQLLSERRGELLDRYAGVVPELRRSAMRSGEILKHHLSSLQ